MSWQAFSWQEIMVQARVGALAERIQPAIDWTGTATGESLRLVGAFLTPLALTEAVLGIWRFGADVGFAGQFFVSEGVFSHWQVWIALAALTRMASVALDRWLKRNAAARTSVE